MPHDVKSDHDTTGCFGHNYVARVFWHAVMRVRYSRWWPRSQL